MSWTERLRDFCVCVLFTERREQLWWTPTRFIPISLTSLTLWPLIHTFFLKSYLSSSSTHLIQLPSSCFFLSSLSVSSRRLRSSPCPSLIHLLVLLFYLCIRSFPSITALLSSPASCFPSSPSLIFASTRLSFSSLSQIKLHPPSFLSSLFPPPCTSSSPFHPLTVRPPFPSFFILSLHPLYVPLLMSPRQTLFPSVSLCPSSSRLGVASPFPFLPPPRRALRPCPPPPSPSFLPLSR